MTKSSVVTKAPTQTSRHSMCARGISLKIAPNTTVRTPKFTIGQRVRVRAAFPPGYTRTPYYTRGCVGTIESLAGLDPNPEHLA